MFSNVEITHQTPKRGREIRVHKVAVVRMEHRPSGLLYFSCGRHCEPPILPTSNSDLPDNLDSESTEFRQKFIQVCENLTRRRRDGVSKSAISHSTQTSDAQSQPHITLASTFLLSRKTPIPLFNTIRLYALGRRQFGVWLARNLEADLFNGTSTQPLETQI